MIKISYLNGSYNRANRISPIDFGQVGNAIIIASNDGWPYQGKPEDLARNALFHINRQLGYEIGLFPVVLSSNSRTNVEGMVYTTEVVFQTVF